MTKILLHTCCADCLLRTRALIGEQIFDNELKPQLDLYFHNPNIFPKSEYDLRRQALEKVSGDLGLNLLTVNNYRPTDYFLTQKNLYQSDDAKQNIHNKNLRCSNCIRLRLATTVDYAIENNYQIVGTTMVASPYLNHKMINQIGETLAEESGLKWMNIPHRKLDMNTKGFYKQNYCGCLFSLNEKVAEKYYAN
ncbi:MAG: epoxyqueuosine reductase QueH [Pseudomonadales bacterium]|jgi:predicted adenine nucleotide alpha hydrolase (AANH) superfamily ATPase|nr:epoxyqueuosine reductase QueH [Pseudomonadales bacterium]